MNVVDADQISRVGRGQIRWLLHLDRSSVYQRMNAWVNKRMNEQDTSVRVNARAEQVAMNGQMSGRMYRRRAERRWRAYLVQCW